jgi:hypothetical protein
VEVLFVFTVDKNHVVRNVVVVLFVVTVNLNHNVRNVVVVLFVVTVNLNHNVRNVVVVPYVNQPFVKLIKTKIINTMDIVLDVTYIYFPMNLFQKIIKPKNMPFWNL